MPKGRLAAGLQVILLSVVGAATLIPPAQGSMLLIPLTSAAASRLDDEIAQAGAMPVGIGAVRGSRLVFGRRSSLFFGMLSNGVLVVAGTPAFCGQPLTLREK